MLMKLTRFLPLAALLALPTRGLAQDAAEAVAEAVAADMTPTNEEIGFIFTTFMFLVAGFLVFFMAAGFAMLEAGLVRSKNVTMQLTKNVALFSLASIFYYLIGYNLMYPLGNWSIGADETGGYLGAFAPALLE